MQIMLLPLVALMLQYPVAFDLRNVAGESYVTSVRTQTGGTCWAHGTMSSLESNLLMTGNWEATGETGEPDLAEYHLDWWNGFNGFWDPDQDPPPTGLAVHEGGDYLISAAYMSRGHGAVRDIDGQSFQEPPPFSTTLFHHYIPMSVAWMTVGWDLGSLGCIKEALMSGGAVATCIFSSSEYMSDEFVHYQPEYAPEAPTHAVAIIGWNDTLETQAPQPGAWLCRNSWGALWGNEGYFWVSYWDKWAGRDEFMGAVSFTDVRLEPFNKALLHDFHGWRDTFVGLETALNAFSADEKCLMDMASFYTAEDSVYYTLQLYSAMEAGSPAGLLCSQSDLALHRGLHSVDLTDPVALSSGDSVYLLLELSSGGHPLDRTAEVPVLLGSDMDVIVASSARQGESFYLSQQGWQDLWDWQGNPYPGTANFCMKLLGTWTGLHVFPEHAFHVSGESCYGPFDPQIVEWTMVFSGSDPAEYRVLSDCEWLTIAGDTSGFISEGDSVCISASVIPLSAATGDTLLSASILFQNLDDPGNSVAREVLLSIREPQLLYTWPLNTDPRWEMDGQWAWGVPEGGGGGLGHPDPESGYTGASVLGYNLAGNYEDGISDYRYLSMETIDCSDVTDAQLRYRRWLGVGGGDIAEIVGTMDYGASGWQVVWSNSGQAVYDSCWVNCVHDISGFADGSGTVTLVWLMGPTGTSGSECGWNLDDIEIWGSRDQGGLPVVPESSLMGRIFPNPAVESASVYCRIPSDGELDISVYDLSGRLVLRPIHGHVSSGLRMITLDLSSLPSGYYVVRSTFQGETATGSLIKL